MFICVNTSKILILLVYVDDIVLNGSSSKAIDHLISLYILSSRWKIWVHFSFSWALRCHFDSFLYLKHAKYAVDLLCKDEMLDV